MIYRKSHRQPKYAQLVMQHSKMVLTSPV